MMFKLKNFLKGLFPQSYLDARRDLYEAKKFSTKKHFATRPSYRLIEEKDYVRQFCKITKKIGIGRSHFFVYPFDERYVRVLRKDTSRLMSVTVDYGVILESKLSNLIKKLDKNDIFSTTSREIIQNIESLQKRIWLLLKKENFEKTKSLLSFFNVMLNRKPQSLHEALQKILFYNALFWQMKHWHNGLGRLDLILIEYYEKDVNSGKLSRDEAKELIKDFCLILGKDLCAKSVSLIGDTGQYILLGGVDKNGNTVQNELTTLFIDTIAEISKPDPKLILRVSENTADNVWFHSLDCIQSGCGSPLMMNEKIIMDSMVAFGYSKDDVWNLGTSACWEPLIIGKSFDQNNPLQSIVAVSPLNEVFESIDDNVTYEELFSAFKKKFEEKILENIRNIKFDCSPLYSLFFDYCIDRKQDFSKGGATYSYHGIQVVGLPNVVNSFINIKTFVYEKKKYNIAYLKKAVKANFIGFENLNYELRNNNFTFGVNNPEIIELTNDIMDFVSSVVSRQKINGTDIKVGFSSPKYITLGKVTNASLDGRKKGEPLAVHISPISAGVDFAEVCDFASHLNYNGNRLNGNVVDFIVSPSYIKSKEKFMFILKDAFNKGVYELQLNVFDKNTLIDAKNHPEKYPNLIVRVWGFSAYFNDLPIEYKENLIARASLYE